MSVSIFSQLLTHSTPIDGKSAMVGFAKGDNFEAEFSDNRRKFRSTMIAPPRMPKRPKHARDYTGQRHGRLTAVFWLKPTQDGRSSIWVVRCDCGKYEFRKKLSRWNGSPDANDACEICQREMEMQEGVKISSKQTFPERIMRWVDELRSIGLTDDEISAIRQLNTIHTKGKSAEEIRTEIANAGVLA